MGFWTPGWRRLVRVALSLSAALLLMSVAAGTAVQAAALSPVTALSYIDVPCAGLQLPTASPDVPYDTNVEWAGTQVPEQRDLPNRSKETGVLCLSNLSAATETWDVSASVGRVKATFFNRKLHRRALLPNIAPIPTVLAATIWSHRVVVVPPYATVQLIIPWPAGLGPGPYAVGVVAAQRPSGAPFSSYSQVFSLLAPPMPPGIRPWPGQAESH